MRNPILYSILFAAGLLTACGGGGSSDADQPLPCNLTKIGEYPLAGMSWSFAISGNRAIIQNEPVTGQTTLHVVNISNPAAPRLDGRIEKSGSTQASVAIGAEYAYFIYRSYVESSWQSFLEKINLSTLPLTVTQSRSIGEMGTRLVLVTENAGYLFGNVDMHFVNLQTFETGESLAFSGNVMALDGSRAYMGGAENAVEVLDISTPEAPVSLGSFANPYDGMPHDIHAIGNHVGVAAGGLGVITFDVSNPQAIAVLNATDTGGWAEGIDSKGTHAFLADGDDGLIVIDIADMVNPTPIGACSVGGYARQVIVNGDQVYVLSNEAGLTVFDISGLG